MWYLKYSIEKYKISVTILDDEGTNDEELIEVNGGVFTTFLAAVEASQNLLYNHSLLCVEQALKEL